MTKRTKPQQISLADYHAADDALEGYCTRCRSFTTGCCEPDARKRECESCGRKDTVYGAEEALLTGLIEIDE